MHQMTCAFGELVVPSFETYFKSEDDSDDSDYDLNDENLNLSEGHRPDDDAI